MKWFDRMKQAFKSSATRAAKQNSAISFQGKGGSYNDLLPADSSDVSPKDQAVAKLSPREWQVFQRLLEGVKIKDIATELGIQASTVGGYCREVYRNLNVSSKAQLILQYGGYRNQEKKDGSFNKEL